MKRVLTAAVFLPLFYFLIYYSSPLPFVVFVIICAAVASWELSLLAEQKGLCSLKFVNLVCTVLVCLAFIRPGGGVPLPAMPALNTTFILTLVSLLLPLFYLFRIHRIQGFFESLGVALMGCFLLGVFMGFHAALRLMDSEGEGSSLVFYLFLVVWAGDSAALYVGRSLGKHPLAPTLSPKKTVEGAVGGALFSMLASLGARSWFMPRLDLVDALILGLLLSILGQVGDLVESGLKRSVGVKDSAAFIPGHGGILDRVDSLLFTAPALFYYYLYLVD